MSEFLSIFEALQRVHGRQNIRVKVIKGRYHRRLCTQNIHQGQGHQRMVSQTSVYTKHTAGSRSSKDGITDVCVHKTYTRVKVIKGRYHRRLYTQNIHTSGSSFSTLQNLSHIIYHYKEVEACNSLTIHMNLQKKTNAMDASLSHFSPKYFY